MIPEPYLEAVYSFFDNVEQGVYHGDRLTLYTERLLKEQARTNDLLLAIYKMLAHR